VLTLAWIPLNYGASILGPKPLETEVPKQKTKKAVAKRMKVTKNGKVLRHHMATGHLLAPKSPARRRRLRRSTVVVGKFAANMRKLLLK
jgi:large subunit ribosomal protein L35